MSGGDVVLVGANMATFPEEPRVAEQVSGFDRAIAGKFEVGLSDSAPKPTEFDVVNDEDHTVIEFDNAKSFLLGPTAALQAPARQH